MPGGLWHFFYAESGSDFFKEDPDVPQPDIVRNVGKRGSQAVWKDIARPQALKILARGQSFVELYCGAGDGVDEDARKDGYIFKRWLAKELPRFDLPLHTQSVDIWNMADREAAQQKAVR